MSSEDTVKLELLKKQRAAFKGQLTYFKNQYSSASTLGAFESLLRRIQLVYDKYSTVQLRVESIDDSATSDREGFEDDFGKLESMVLNKIHDLKRSEDSIVSASFHSNTTHDASSVPHSSMEIRLPELKLPTFSGADCDWLAFRDVFVDLIHSKPIESTIKYVYLISHIRSGSAYTLIEHLPVTSENYETAWKTVCDRYNNEVTIQKVHMMEIYNIKTPQENSSKSLQVFIDHILKHYNSLKSLKVKVEEWDLMLSHHLIQSLDNCSRTDVIKKSKSNSVLSFTELIQILRNRVQLLQALQSNTSRQSSRQHKDPIRKFTSNQNRSVLVSNSNSCSYCSGPHAILQCSLFNDDKLSPQMRFQFIRQNKLCTNCLISSHNVRDCMTPPCSICSLKHNSRLHFKNYQNVRVQKCAPTLNSTTASATFPSPKAIQQPLESKNAQDTNTNTSLSCLPSYHSSPIGISKLGEEIGWPSKHVTTKPIIMIGTALVNAITSCGNQVICRAILDSGSHMNFITTEACNFLNSKRYPTCNTISGIGGKESIIKQKTYLTISSRVSDYKIHLKFYIIPKITNDVPSIPLNFDMESIPLEINLADPHFNVPDRIDLLIGVEVYNQLFKNKSVKIFKELPPLYDTELGYVVCGKTVGSLKRPQAKQPSYVSLCSIQTLESQLKQFWELETVSLKNTYSQEERLCEEHFTKHVQRLKNGRYSVSLPVKSNLNELGESQQSARRQFLSLEKRLVSRKDIYAEYQNFMSEYISLGHMVPIVASNTINLQTTQTNYLPHHYVLKDRSTTTKLRVVFNASAKTSSQLSLNDCLMVGPTIQQNLFSIILRFRTHVYAFCGDIAKMYRQIRLQQEQQDLQRIFWRDHPSKQLQEFKLCTVTYGTASAPFLATRTLKQLGIDEHDKFPKASQVVANDFYVDDVLTGGTTLDDATTLKSDLTKLLNRAGFELRKFFSNDPALASKDQSQPEIALVLGLLWNTASDNFETNFNKLSLSTHCSKRNMLSEICQLFDPLGFCAPIIVTAKLFMQTLWTLQDMSWDDTIPDIIATQWNKFKSELCDLGKISVPRCILLPHSKRIELHGFGDASEQAFGCVIYSRVTDFSDNHQVKLLCAKSRVAPLKKQSIPRLELCAALLFAETTSLLINVLNITCDSIYFWSDSEITLFCIKSAPHKYSTFVANRVAKIQEYTSSTNWCYVNTASNPADLVSRGMMPSELADAILWWSGPEFLRQDKSDWPKSGNQQLSPDLMNLEARQTSITVLSQPITFNIFERFHSFTTLLRVVSYIFRFHKNCKSKQRAYSSILLSPVEIENALQVLIKIVQHATFVDEIKCLNNSQPVSIKSALKSLNPFMDNAGVLRVGGRLQNAPISYDYKHQIVVPGSHLFVKLLVQHEHLRLLHAGPQALLYNLRLTYWIIGGRNLCRAVVNKCIRCFYARPHTKNQITGDLPTDRVTRFARPFVVVGIDFCGPFFTKSHVRSKLTNRIYICLFVCFSTKAVHLEIVMNLSTESFILCLRRFVARRGMCSKIYSDNATNFIGAHSELRELRELFLSQHLQHETTRYCTSNNIEWLTIPPRSPHFGGLWESAIKSAKHHMKRVIGKSSLTIEEFYTLTAQIEAVLNSRPLTAMSNDPSDFNALSPGHFIIGAPLTSIMEPSILDLQTNRLSRFQLLQQRLQIIWKRWHLEYLADLQRRHKWHRGTHKYQVGSLVLLHDENLPPMKWSLGRITNIHPGKDGIVRVVTIKTAQSLLKRAVNRISVLPLDED